MKTVPIRCDNCGYPKMEYYCMLRYTVNTKRGDMIRFLRCPQCETQEGLVTGPIISTDKHPFVHVNNS